MWPICHSCSVISLENWVKVGRPGQGGCIWNVLLCCHHLRLHVSILFLCSSDQKAKTAFSADLPTIPPGGRMESYVNARWASCVCVCGGGRDGNKGGEGIERKLSVFFSFQAGFWSYRFSWQGSKLWQIEHSFLLPVHQ